MQTLNITEARKRLPELVKKAYLNSKSFTITKGGIPMAKITKVDKAASKSKVSKKDIEGALKTAKSIKWIWDDEWKNKTTEEIADLLAERAWNSHAS